MVSFTHSIISLHTLLSTRLIFHTVIIKRIFHDFIFTKLTGSSYNIEVVDFIYTNISKLGNFIL